MTVFNAVCFAVLMDHHKQGVEEAHPEYIKEKLEIFEVCEAYSAFSLLDIRNKFRVAQWAKKWNVKVDFLYEKS